MSELLLVTASCSLARSLRTTASLCAAGCVLSIARHKHRHWLDAGAFQQSYLSARSAALSCLLADTLAAHLGCRGRTPSGRRARRSAAGCGHHTAAAAPPSPPPPWWHRRPSPPVALHNHLQGFWPATGTAAHTIADFERPDSPQGQQARNSSAEIRAGGTAPSQAT